ncbi:glycosyltransferase family protein [Paracoccus jiaweipingae]|uniref:hypothetical protein n=1 Tax=unclassified Paracoccus (in: a-proteobacteria) TaxID=2688777 RepID=UPI00378B9DE3
MTNLIYLSPVPWNSFAQRPHKFAAWFHDRHRGRVLWVDPYPTRLPKLSDLRRLSAPATDGGGTPRPDWLQVTGLRSLPVEPLPGAQHLNRQFWRAALAGMRRFADAGRCVVVTGKPSRFALAALDALADLPRIHDAMDDFPAFYDGFSRRAMLRTEAAMARRVDTVWASGVQLYRHWQGLHPDVRLVPNGLDPASLRGVGTVMPDPQQPVIGYLGTVAGWFDWPLVVALARLVPQAVVPVIGPRHGTVPRDLPGNIRLLPPCEQGQAMTRMAGFDIGLIPFRRDRLTASVDPIKFYEYRALGMPVISTPFGDMAARGGQDGVFLVQGAGDLPAAIQAARQQVGPRRIDPAFARDNSWQARFDATGL